MDDTHHVSMCPGAPGVGLLEEYNGANYPFVRLVMVIPSPYGPCMNHGPWMDYITTRILANTGQHYTTVRVTGDDQVNRYIDKSLLPFWSYTVVLVPVVIGGAAGAFAIDGLPKLAS